MFDLLWYGLKRLFSDYRTWRSNLEAEAGLVCVLVIVWNVCVRTFIHLALGINWGSVIYIERNFGKSRKVGFRLCSLLFSYCFFISKEPWTFSLAWWTRTVTTEIWGTGFAHATNGSSDVVLDLVKNRSTVIHVLCVIYLRILSFCYFLLMFQTLL